ncbi:MAG TPA: SelB C-terminal domain-containing protein, partial [Gemmatimonadaceae bacterium]|nr:SelB C-terminal domain-containing protein [Gemmatimonadaceae bacterium]
NQLDVAMPGARTAIALAGVETGEVPRGSTLVGDSAWLPTTLIRADVTVLPGAEGSFGPRTQLRFHAGTSDVGARVVAREIRAGTPSSARVVLEEPVVLRAGDRFVLRSSAPLNTIGGGIVTDPHAPRRARPWPVGLLPQERLQRLLIEAGAAGLDSAALPVRLGLAPSECRVLLAESAREHFVIGSRVVARSIHHELGQRLVQLIDAHHAERPLDPGISAQLARSRLAAAPELIESVIQARVDAGDIAQLGGVLKRAGWTPALSDGDVHLADRVRSRLATAGAEPPSADEIVEELGTGVQAVLRFLEREGEIVQVEEGRYYEASQLTLLVGRLRQALGGGRMKSPSELREELGLSRKFLIPLLEYCDRVGYTNRGATGRVWRGT